MSNVIHGVGKPRILLSYTQINTGTDTVTSGTAISVTINTATSYTPGQIVNHLIETIDSAGSLIAGKITAWNDSTKIATVDSWAGGGTPDATRIVIIRGRVIELPFCTNILAEAFNIDVVKHKLYNGDIYTIKKGWYVKIILDYSNHISGENLALLEPLLDSGQDDFYVYPRSDNPSIKYKVNFPEGYSFGYAQKPFHRAHKSVVLVFVGAKRLTTNISLVFYDVRYLVAEDGQIIITETGDEIKV